MPRKILLADDSVTAQNMGRKILTEAGYEITTVNNGTAAMRKISETKPDLVILDVHMPGYGGLEICQRLRETPKLARIPVLLTVGKLEPFRSDDARRVNADAFVIKPFEASELLAVLARLEDKIVPDEDEDSAWRLRLRIPASFAKRDESPAEPPGDATPAEPIVPGAEETAPPIEATTPETVVPMDAVPSTVPGPQEVTSRETFAGLAPAASQPAGEYFGSPELVKTEPEPVGQEPASAPFLLEPEAFSGNIASAPETSAEAVVASPPALEPAITDEIAAALASLVPTVSDGAADQSPDAQRTDTLYDYATAAMVPVMEDEIYAGPRWIADQVPVSEEESALILDLEMQRAYAALAAADAARLANYSPAIPVASQPESAAPQPEFQPELQSKLAEQPRETSDAEVTFNVAAHTDSEDDLIYSEIAAAKLATANQTEDAIQPVPDATSAAAEPEAEEKAAYAVAAAGVAAVSSGPAALEPATEIPEVPCAPAEPASPQGEAELATAWEHWKQVRESVVSPEFTAQIAESAASVVQETHNELPLESTQPEASADTADEVNEIASIVDSVLADLKPKLMEEIAKKMGKGKKK